ncbi:MULTISPECIES: outer membrane lipoprotein carrier protein LolA [Devosia]|jgi:outer membrane lipoprotein-sorting protein|uniref:Outer-membrane lipoprotein carrier protein LolA n=1 Tax=Devosia litorisediminis TaxID=2829817 RepID=A0A942IFG1_9HYPH|nr:MULTISPECIES: outer membrane lipoprotein carrier protein LolA [Devosia]MBS3850510.1 outer-membrane lipoprotein carrier protein LolA [Devosia litorisediminis]MCZ4347828.1 outer membrane lipoprotein carrier protein LolA [Devosia neptuniae]|tara:strand:- start:2134 stop:2757 length:624 start_codon:yes stop_codon:yes gene_type:complete
MIRRDALLLGLSAAFALSTSAWALDRALTPQEQQLIANIGAHNSAIRTMVGRFLQIDTNGGRTEGTFFLERPNKIAFRYAPPSREEIVSVGNGFYVLNRKEETYYAYPQDSIPLRQFLGDTINLLDANVIDVTTSDGYMSITVIDETIAGTVQVSLIFGTDTLDLVQWSLVEPSGAELTFSLYDVEKDREIPRTYFSIPANYKPTRK